MSDDNNLTIILNNVTADNDGKFTEIKSIKSMEGKINGTQVNVTEDKAGEGIKQEAFKIKLNENKVNEPVDPKIETTALKSGQENLGAAQTELEAAKKTTISENLTSSAEQSMKGQGGGSKRSRKARRTKKGGKKRRSTRRSR